MSGDEPARGLHNAIFASCDATDIAKKRCDLRNVDSPALGVSLLARLIDQVSGTDGRSYARRSEVSLAHASFVF